MQAHSRIVVRLRRVDHEPSSVKIDADGTWAWDSNDRSIVVTLADRFPFAIEVAFDTKLEPEGDVDVPLRVTVPTGTPVGTAIHVASSRAGWTHAPLTRTGDVAQGTIKVPRGGYASFKITRGGWPTVEKGDGCAEIDNRRVFGAATRPVVVSVTAFADRCP